MSGIGTGTQTAGSGETTDVNITQVGGATFSLGQALAVASLPVVLTAAQISTLTPLATVAVTQSTSPWVVSLTSTTITGSVAVTNAGLTALNGAISGTEVQVDVLTMPTVTVQATNLDIRDLSSASDSVTVVNAGLTALNGAISGTEVQVDVLTIAAGTNYVGKVRLTDGTLDSSIVDETGSSAVDALAVGGGTPHDSVDSGNPVKIGYKAYSPDGTTPGTAVAENDRTNAKGDLDGRLFVNTKSPRSLHKHLDGTAAYTDESVISDPGDGFQAVITGITFSSGEAIAINFFLEEGSTKIFGPIYIEATAGRGFTAQGMYLPCTASTAVTLTTSAANDQSFDLDYFIQAV